MAPVTFRIKHNISKWLSRPSHGMGPAYLSSFALASGKSQVPIFPQLRLPLYQLPSLLADFYPFIRLQLPQETSSGKPALTTLTRSGLLCVLPTP